VLCEFREWANLTQIRFHQNTTNEEYKAAEGRKQMMTLALILRAFPAPWQVASTEPNVF
jgi:hypothetical protein